MTASSPRPALHARGKEGALLHALKNVIILPYLLSLNRGSRPSSRALVVSNSRFAPEAHRAVGLPQYGGRRLYKRRRRHPELLVPLAAATEVATAAATVAATAVATTTAASSEGGGGEGGGEGGGGGGGGDGSGDEGRGGDGGGGDAGGGNGGGGDGGGGDGGGGDGGGSDGGGVG